MSLTSNRPKHVASKIDGLPARRSGIWVQRKHYYLKKYIEIFHKGMRGKWDSLIYIDLFAGPGICWIEETDEYVNGSPLIALQYEFDQFWFIEDDSRGYEALKSRTASSPKLKSINFIQGDCNSCVRKINIRTRDLCLAFIDPTGIKAQRFETIRSLTQGRRVDLLMTVHTGLAIKYNIGQYLRQIGRSTLDDFVGSNEWRDVISEHMVAQEALTKILEVFKSNLRKIDYIVAESTVGVQNTKNRTLYFMLFASKHRLGTKYWKAVQSTDESGQRYLNFA